MTSSSWPSRVVDRSSVDHRFDLVQGRLVHALTAGPKASRPDRGPVVLVHGLAVSSRYLRPSLERLAAGRQVLAPDRPGIGRSERPGRPHTLPDLADWLAEWLQAIGMQDVALVGHSLGCQLVVELAARHPQRVRAVVLANPAPDPGLRPSWRQALRLLRDGPRERPALIPIAARDYVQGSARRMVRVLREAKRRDFADHLSQVRVPTLVLHGGRDPLVTDQWVDRLVAALPDGSRTTLPDAPHAAHFSTPGPFVDAVRHFLDS